MGLAAESARTVEYAGAGLSELELAWATTVHKSQVRVTLREEGCLLSGGRGCICFCSVSVCSKNCREQSVNVWMRALAWGVCTVQAWAYGAACAVQGLLVSC